MVENSSRLLPSCQLPSSFVALLTEADRDIRLLEPGNPYRLYEFLHATARRIAPLDAFYVCLYSEADQALFFPYNADGALYDSPVTVSLGNGPTSRVVRQCSPVVWNSEAEGQASGGIMFGQMDRFSLSAMHVPIRTREKTGLSALGVLACQSYQPDAYSAEAVEALQWLADRAAMALTRERDESAWRHRLRAAEALEFERQRPLLAITKEFVAMLQTLTASAEALRPLAPQDYPALSTAILRLCDDCYKAQTHANQLPLHPDLVPPTAPANPLLGELTTAETVILQHLAEGKSTRKIALAICVSENTIKFHCKNIFHKLEVKNRVAAVCLWLSTQS